MPSTLGNEPKQKESSMSDPNQRIDPAYRGTPTYKDRYVASSTGISGLWTIAGLVAIALIIAGLIYSYSGGGTNLSSNTAPVVGMNSPASGPTGAGGASPASPQGDVPPAVQPVAPAPAK
jgi:hypothetical protein